MSLATLKTDLLALEASFTSPIKPGTVVRTAAAVMIDGADVLDLFMAAPPGAAADPDKAECIACCERIKTKANVELSKVGAGVGFTWGDGSFLKLVLQLLPLILALFKTPPAPTP